MTAKISVAFDQKGNYINIQDAVKGGVYYCLNCKERVSAAKGKKNIHHYRHVTKKDKEKLAECELYTAGDSDFTVLLNEQLYENKVRFILDQSLEMKIKLPYLNKSAISRMNFDDLYFSIQIESNVIYSTNLGKESNRRYLPVSITPEYIIEIKNEKNAKLLEYDIEKNPKLFQRRMILFKKINGEFINIPYDKTNLSDEFFLVSNQEIIMHSDIKLKKHLDNMGVHIYHCFLDNLSNSLIEWFRMVTGYNIIPNRKWIDLVFPNSFQYSNHCMLVETNNVLIQVTPYTENDKISVTNTKGKVITLENIESSIFRLNLEFNQVYNLRLNHEISNEITLKRIHEIHPTSNYSPEVLLNNKVYNIVGNSFEKAYSIESENNFIVFSSNECPYVTKFLEQIPKAVHFPFIGTIYKRKELKEAELEWGLLLTSQKWEVVMNHEYMSVLNTLKQNRVNNQSTYIAKLLKNYNRLPKEFINTIRGGQRYDYIR